MTLPELLNSNSRRRTHESKGRSTRGEKNPGAKLTEEDVKFIKKEFEAGKKDSYIANRFNVGRQTINSIRNKKLWSYVNV